MVILNTNMISLPRLDNAHRENHRINWLIQMKVHDLNIEIAISWIDLVLWVVEKNLLIPDWVDVFFYHQGLLNVLGFQSGFLILFDITLAPAKIQVTTWQSLLDYIPEW